MGLFGPKTKEEYLRHLEYLNNQLAKAQTDLAFWKARKSDKNYPKNSVLSYIASAQSKVNNIKAEISTTKAKMKMAK